MNELKRLNRNNLKSTLNSFNELIRDKQLTSKVIDYLTETYQEIYTNTNKHHSERNRFNVGRFTCSFMYQELDLPAIGKGRGLYVNFIDNKKILPSFLKPLNEFIRFYDDDQGTHRMEMMIFNFT